MMCSPHWGAGGGNELANEFKYPWNVSAYHLDLRRLHGPSGSTILTMRKPASAGKPPRPSEEVCLNGLMVC